MLKRSILFVTLFFSFSVHALTVQVLGRGGTELLSEAREVSLPSHLGKISFDLFTEKNIPLSGGEHGFSMLFNLGNEIEVISDIEMKAHGWCFSLNGETPETMADETPVVDPNSRIQWYYAYAHYKEGVWIAQCASE